jgi:glycerol-3-phosphate dehydrogenase
LVPVVVTDIGGLLKKYNDDNQICVCSFSMAEDAVNAAIKVGSLQSSNNCITENLALIGADGYEPSSFTVLTQQYVRMKQTYGGKVVPGVFDTAAAQHLVHSYGGMAQRVALIAQVRSSLISKTVLYITLLPL